MPPPCAAEMNWPFLQGPGTAVHRAEYIYPANNEPMREGGRGWGLAVGERASSCPSLAAAAHIEVKAGEKQVEEEEEEEDTLTDH